MASAKKSTNAANTAMVQRVGKRLANAVELYLKQNGFEADVKNYSWELTWYKISLPMHSVCLAVKSWFMKDFSPYTQNETGLAIVLGHEIAHAVAKHSAEQLTKQQNQQTGTSILGICVEPDSW